MITVADVMKLPSMYGATILAGHAGISNSVESVTVLEYGQITSTLDELFYQTEFQENALIISSFATIADDVDAQCENIRRYHAIGCVGFILFYIGLILPSVDDRVIACCNELDLVLITMPGDIRTHKYSDVIGDIYHAIFKDQQAGSNYAQKIKSKKVKMHLDMNLMLCYDTHKFIGELMFALLRRVRRMTRQQMLDSYRKLVIAKQDAAHMMSADDHDAMFSQTLQAKAKSTLTAMNAPMRALLEEISDPRTFMIIQRYYVKGLTDQAIGREMNLTGARVNQIRLGYVRSLTNQAS